FARRSVEAQYGELIPVDRGFNRRGRNVIRKLQLDRLETCRGRSVDPFEQRAIGEKGAQVGGKTRHELSPMIPLRADARTYSLALQLAQTPFRKTHVKQHGLPYCSIARRRHRPGGDGTDA